MTLFFATIVLPLLFFGISLSLDLGAYLTLQSNAQKAVDDASHTGVRFLPDTAEAHSAATERLAYYGFQPGKSANSIHRLEVVNDAVLAEVKQVLPLRFASWFGLKVDLPVVVSAVARSVPTDVMILMDVSQYLSPSLEGTESMGDEILWPAAHFFEHELSLTKDGNKLDARVLTQQCFNPALYSLKMATLRSFDYLSAFQRNNIGLAVYPGVQADSIDLLRPVVEPGRLSPELGEVYYHPVVQAYSSTSYCLAAAERESTALHYRLPDFLERETAPDETLRPVPLVLPGAWQLDRALYSSVRAHDLIWGYPTRGYDVASTSRVLEQAVQNAITPTREDRGGLRSNRKIVVIAFSGDFPQEFGKRFPDPIAADALRKAFKRIRDIAKNFQAQVVLHYVFFNHEASSEFDQRDSAAHALKDLFDQESIRTSDFSMQATLHFGLNPDTAYQSILDYLLFSIRSSTTGR